MAMTRQNATVPADRTIERRLTIAAPRAQVFRALMDPGTLSRWLFAAVDLTPEQGASYSFEWRDTTVPATARGEILELIPDSRLVLSWFMEADGVTTEASFDLADAAGGGTEVRFAHRGLPSEPEWNPRFENVALEWDKVLLNLRFLLEERGEGKHLFYFRTQKTLPGPLERVFHAWTTPTGLGAWVARDLFVMPEEGGDLTGVTLDSGKAIIASYQRIAPHRHLRFLWSEGGVRGLIGVSFWPSKDGTDLTLTLRSFALLEMERGFVQGLWEKRFQRLETYLTREPLPAPAGAASGTTPAGSVPSAGAVSRTRPPSGTGTMASSGSGAPRTGTAATPKPGADVAPPEIRLTRVLEAPSQRVWNALTDAALMRRWLVGWTDFEPRAGSSFALIWDDYGEVLGRVLSVQPGESARLTWDLAEAERSTTVDLRLVSAANQPGECTLELVHGGWAQDDAGSRIQSSCESGWSVLLAMLDFYLRHGAGKEKREFFLLRRLSVPTEEARRLLTTTEGLQSWIAAAARVEPKSGGVFDLQSAGGPRYRGRVVAWDASGEGAAELDEPEPSIFRWMIAADGQGSRVEVMLRTYSGSAEWLEGERRRWVEGLKKLWHV